jgi:FkbM family methyltransferase
MNAPKDHLLKKLEALLNQSAADVKLREKTAFDKELQGNKNVLIFGAGGLGKKSARILNKAGYNICGFIDNNWKDKGSDCDGIKVYSPREAWKKYGKSVGVVVGIYNGQATETMGDRLRPLVKIGFSKIVHIGLFGWKFPPLLLPLYSLDRPSNLLSHKKEIIEAYHLFKEFESRKLFVNHVAWRLDLDFNHLPKPTKETIYFNKRLVLPHSGEYLIDGGAYNGDTLKSFLAEFGKKGYYKIACFEPDPKNYIKLRKTAVQLRPRGQPVKVYPYALGQKSSKCRIEGSGRPSSRVGIGKTIVICKTIDSYAEKNFKPTFIKLDVEGHELSALQGASQTIRKNKPVLAISAYHRQNDLWKIPLAIFKMQSEYIFRLKPHVADGWDLVLYAVPQERLKS